MWTNHRGPENHEQMNSSLESEQILTVVCIYAPNNSWEQPVCWGSLGGVLKGSSSSESLETLELMWTMTVRPGWRDWAHHAKAQVFGAYRHHKRRRSNGKWMMETEVRAADLLVRRGNDLQARQALFSPLLIFLVLLCIFHVALKARMSLNR